MSAADSEVSVPSFVLCVPFHPRNHFVKYVFDRFAGSISMRLIGEHDQPHGSAVAANRLIHTFRLYRERAAVIVGFAVDEQERGLQFIGVHKWGHVEVCFRSFPECALLALKTEWGERAIVSAASSDSRAE